MVLQQKMHVQNGTEKCPLVTTHTSEGAKNKKGSGQLFLNPKVKNSK